MGNARIRAEVAQRGLVVLCMVCGEKYRHRPEKDGRLRNQWSPCCLARMRPRAWIKKYPDSARRMVIEARKFKRLWD